VRLADYLVAFGLSIENFVLPFLFIIIPFMSFNIPIAYLSAVMVAFSRFSADGEYAAMLASGFSLKRAIKPVFAIGFVLYLAAMICSVFGEPWGRREFVNFFFRKTQTELDNILKFKLQPGVFLDDFLGYTLYAERISEDRTYLENMTLENGVIHNSSSETNERTIIKFEGLDLDILRLFQDQILRGEDAEDDYRSYPPRELYSYVKRIEHDEKTEKKIFWRANFLFHQRIALPFAIMFFACFGVALGVVDPRGGKNRAYLGAIVGIIAGYIVMTVFQQFATKGQIPAIVGAWLPNLMLLSFGVWLLYQKNRLPPSESVFDYHNIPWAFKLLTRIKLKK
jgi:lipopolysaccharide export system permease protein